MNITALLARSALAVAAFGSLGTAVAGEGLSKYYSLQNSARYYSAAPSTVGASLVVIRYKDSSGAATGIGTSAGKASTGSTLVGAGDKATSGNSTVVAQADSYESITGSAASTGTALSTYKTNSGTTPSGWSGFTNSGNYSLVTANGGVALNNVYVGGDLNITLNISGGTWNTSPHGGGNCGCVSHS